jgi:hypothetical protein
MGFLRSELEVASTLVSVAETTSSCESALRNLRNAWVALKTAQEFAGKLDLGCGERRAFHDSAWRVVPAIGEPARAVGDQARLISTPWTSSALLR